MILAIDSGNTSISFALFDPEKLKQHSPPPQPLAHYTLHNVPSRSPDEYWLTLSSLLRLDNINILDVSSVAIAGVVPEILDILVQAFQSRLKKKPLLISHNAPGLHVSISPSIPLPHSIGADRIANAEAAVRFHNGLRIIVDIGTATTFDIIDSHNSYLGGIICPGLKLSRDILSQATAKLPWVHLNNPPPSVIGTRTEDAIASGLLYGYAAMINGLVQKISTELKQTPNTLITTGGYAHIIAPLISSLHHNDPFLTLRGLASWVASAQE